MQLVGTDTATCRHDQIRYLVSCMFLSNHILTALKWRYDLEEYM